jgi:hypothetical protein
MTVRIKKGPSALKHAGYSATSILPGESEAEFSKLHADLVREWTPNGVLEDEIVASMAHLVWRRKNSERFELRSLPSGG